MDPEKERLLDRYLIQVEKMPTIPAIVGRILRLLDDPEVSLDEVAQCVAADPVVAARVVRLANSPLYAARRRIESIDHAVKHLGTRAIRELVVTTSIVEIFRGESDRIDLDRLWAHSFGCAILARELVALLALEGGEEAYMAGLLHDVGLLVIALNMGGMFQAVLDQVAQGGTTLCRAEAENLGLDHTDFGTWFAARMELPPKTRSVIAHHHRPEDAPTPRGMVAVVTLADLFCRVRGLGYGIEEFFRVELRAEPAWALLCEEAPKLDEIDLERLSFEIDDRIDEICAAVEGMLGRRLARDPT